MGDLFVLVLTTCFGFGVCFVSWRVGYFLSDKLAFEKVALKWWEQGLGILLAIGLALIIQLPVIDVLYDFGISKAEFFAVMAAGWSVPYYAAFIVVFGFLIVHFWRWIKPLLRGALVKQP